MTAAALDFGPDDDRYLAELAELVAIPTVSRDADPATMLTAARWLAGRLAFAGGRVEPTAGHPVVRGEWLGAPADIANGVSFFAAERSGWVTGQVIAIDGGSAFL